MPAPKPHKPGAERRKFRPDVIETYTVSTEITLLQFLIESMPHRKRTTVKELLKHNQVAIGDSPVTQHNTPLNPGDTVRVNLTREFQTFYNRRLKIVYEDDDIIVANKGYGLLSMGTDRIKEGTAYSILRDWVKRKDPRNKLFIVHRLDRDTSGLMMFAKTEKAKEQMQYNWNNMVLSRCYLAVVEGHIEPSEGTIKSYLAENSQFEVYSTENPKEGQLAVTRYKTVKTSSKYSLLEVELDTGRKNQIRVHLSDKGCPISGDRKYGGATSPIHRLALHAQTLRFIHPTTRRDMNFSTPVPASFLKLLGSK